MIENGPDLRRDRAYAGHDRACVESTVEQTQRDCGNRPHPNVGGLGAARLLRLSRLLGRRYAFATFPVTRSRSTGRSHSRLAASTPRPSASESFRWSRPGSGLASHSRRGTASRIPGSERQSCRWLRDTRSSTTSSSGAALPLDREREDWAPWPRPVDQHGADESFRNWGPARRAPTAKSGLPRQEPTRGSRTEVRLGAAARAQSASATARTHRSPSAVQVRQPRPCA